MSLPTLIFDFDSTLINVESLELLFEMCLKNHPNKNTILRQIKQITDLGMEGKITFQESISQRIQLLHAYRDLVTQVGQLIKTIHITPSVLKNRQFFADNAPKIYVISGGFDELTLPTTQFLGIPDTHVFTNRFLYDKDNQIYGLDQTRLTSQTQGKVNQLRLLNLPHPIIAIGDGFTDLEMYLEGAADDFIAFTENVSRNSVLSQAPHQADNFNQLISLLQSA